MRILTKFLIILFAILFISCEESQDNEVWPPNYSAEAPRPIITKIYPDPATSDQDEVSFAGVGIIYIEGQNFSNSINGNRVHFNGQIGTVLEASTTLLKVRMSNVFGDSVKVHVNSAGAILYADYNGQDYYSPFRAKNTVPKYVDIDVEVYSVAVDADDNVYVLTTDKEILKISHPDSQAVVFADSTIASTATNMRMGPDGVLFYANNGRTLYLADAAGNISRERLKKKVGHIDFDENKNMYLAGKGEVIELLTDISADDEIVADYAGYEITSLRVYNGFVYSSIKYNRTIDDSDYDSTAVLEEIWRNEILDVDGNLGPNELVFDWSAFSGESGPSIASITFDEDGEMYIGQSSGEAIYLLNAGEYFYPEVLSSPVTNLTWGNGNYFYINSHPDEVSDRALIRVETTIKGAIYYGR